MNANPKLGTMKIKKGRPNLPSSTTLKRICKAWTTCNKESY
jgi:hypothetical protein